MKPYILAAGLALFSLPATAQDTRALAEQYANMPQVQEMMTNMFSPESMAAQFANSLPPNVTVTEAQKTQIGAMLSEAMSRLRPRMQALMIEGSAETFSAPELEALIAFYGSEHGASVMQKMQPFFTSVMAKMAPEMQQMQREVMPKVMQILQGQQ